jgi:DHA1 family tetracycline resistance protein-like MFS transporter
LTEPHPTASWRTWVEPWYLSYALLGASAAGLAPILLPLAVSRGGDLAQVGLIMAAFNLGGFIAPLWGRIADRRHCYRTILAGGLAVTAVGLALFPFAPTPLLQLVLALAQGGGAVAAATVGNMLIVEAHPRHEWDKRIGWLQTFYGVGQVGGLVLAGLASQISMAVSLPFAAGLSMLALLPAASIRRPARSESTPRPVLTHPARHVDLSAGSPQRYHHHLGSVSPHDWMRPLLSPFGWFLLAWLLSFAGTTGFFSLYPVLMGGAYGIPPEISAPAFAVAAALGLGLYAPAGRWSERFGALRILQAGLLVRGLAFTGLVLLCVLPTGGTSVPALAAFLFVVLAWSLLSVASTAATAQLAPTGEGEALGLYNATTAVAGVLGSFLGGWLASRWGYVTIPAMGIAGVALGIVLLFVITRRKQSLQGSSIVERS